MISDQLDGSIVEQIIKELIGEGTEGIKPVLELLFNGKRQKSPSFINPR